MLDLLRWHGAEEVEHRSVTFDTYQHIDGNWARRAAAMALVAPVMAWLWIRGVRFLMETDPTLPGPPRWRDFQRAVRAELAPSAREILSAIPTLPGPRIPPLPGGLDPASTRVPRRLAGRPVDEDGHER